MSKESKRREALVYHAKPTPGKIKVVPTKKYSSQRDLSLAYSPGVAEPCLEIAKDKTNVYKYTTKGNLVAVISNGTAVLGLGDIGAEASKPVMEGKGLLFKIFADLDCFDIEVDTKNVDEFIETVKRISPTFGGINLEDIKAPEAFEIERRLKEELDIPVMHDDQHGTAIISSAALLNALEIAEKNIEDVKIVISGAGSAAISCTNLYVKLGALKENILMFDVDGLITTNRTDLGPEQMEFARDIEPISMQEAFKGADVFLGLSVGNIVTPEMLRTMNDNPIVFAMANPNPEIEYDTAVATREDLIMATGRSDHPNQVNNVLGFPFIFRGAMDVRATKINEEMKLAACHAIAQLAKEPVPEQVNIAYGETKLQFGREYIIPKPFDPRLIATIPPAVARAAMESGVAQEPIKDWGRYEDQLYSRMGSDNRLIRLILNRARTNPKRIVFAEADNLDVVKAAQIVHEDGIAIPILLGRRDVIEELMEEIGWEDNVLIIDPKADEEKPRRDRYAHEFWKLRDRKGVTEFDAGKYLRQRNYFAAMMVKLGDADALITGVAQSYPRSVRPMMEIIGMAPGVQKVATTNLMITERGPLFISDTSINIDPDAIELAKIAQMTDRTARMFGIEPSIAMISYANFGSSEHPQATKVTEAVNYLHRYYPDITVDGEIQADFALNPKMLKEKFPFSKLAGKKVNTLVFPNLEAGNSTYKLIKELYQTDSIGPIMMGMQKPVHILQLNASVDEIVNMAAVAVIDAQQKEKYELKRQQESGPQPSVT
jgi:malate dehydrogenase (oxaloacetate-decarboxylating)(NADP+)